MSKYSEILKKLIKKMDAEDCEEMGEEDSDLLAMSSEEGEEKKEDGKEEGMGMMEMLASDDDAEEKEELSEEEIKELLGQKNKVPKPKGLMTISVSEMSAAKKKGKGRPKGSKMRF